MADHATKTDTRARTWRTVLAVLVVAVPVVPVGVGIVLDELHDVIPADLYVKLAGLGAIITALAGIATRVMAIPAVDRLLARIGLGKGAGSGGE